MDGGDAIDLDIVDVGTELFSPEVIEVGDGVVIAFGRVIAQPPFQSWVIRGAILIDGWCWWRRWRGRDESAYAGEEALGRVRRVAWGGYG